MGKLIVLLVCVCYLLSSGLNLKKISQLFWNGKVCSRNFHFKRQHFTYRSTIVPWLAHLWSHNTDWKLNEIRLQKIIGRSVLLQNLRPLISSIFRHGLYIVILSNKWCVAIIMSDYKLSGAYFLHILTPINVVFHSLVWLQKYKNKLTTFS